MSTASEPPEKQVSTSTISFNHTFESWSALSPTILTTVIFSLHSTYFPATLTTTMTDSPGSSSPANNTSGMLESFVDIYIS